MQELAKYLPDLHPLSLNFLHTFPADFQEFMAGYCTRSGIAIVQMLNGLHNCEVTVALDGTVTWGSVRRIANNALGGGTYIEVEDDGAHLVTYPTPTSMSLARFQGNQGRVIRAGATLNLHGRHPLVRLGRHCYSSTSETDDHVQITMDEQAGIMCGRWIRGYDWQLLYSFG
jgi:hypothetical protein